VLPLDSQHFAENSTRYPWNLSRFDPCCRSCSAEASRLWFASLTPQQIAARNAQRAQRRAMSIASRKQAAVFYTPVQVAIQATKKAAAMEQKTRKALLRRRLLRTFGPKPDGIKPKIRRDMEAAIRRRLIEAAGKASDMPSIAPDSQTHAHK
jgi:hypothetical protein